MIEQLVCNIESVQPAIVRSKPNLTIINQIESKKMFKADAATQGPKDTRALRWHSDVALYDLDTLRTLPQDLGIWPGTHTVE